MNEAMRNAIHLVVVFAGVLIVFRIGSLVERAKRNSLRWQQRPEWQQRLFARIPGAVVAFSILLLVDLVILPT